MRIQIRYFAIFAILWSSVAASSQSFFPNTTEFHIGPSSFVNTSIAYALCSETSESNEKDCNVFLETINEDDSTTILSCKVVLKTRCKNSQIGHVIQLVPQSDDKLVIIWTDHANRTDTSLRLTSLRLSDCDSVEKSLLYRNDYYKGGIIRADDVKLFRYQGDSEDSVIFPYTRYCGSGQYCRLRVDSRGNIISEEVEWLDGKAKIIPMERSVMDEEYVVISSDWNNLEVTLAGSKVNKTEVVQSIRTAGKPASYSTAHNVLSVCYKTTAKTSNCSMISLEDDGVIYKAPKFTNVSVTFKNRTILTSVYSLPNEMIVLSVECPDEAPFEDRCASISSEVYRLTLLNASGKQIGSLRLEGFQCDSHYFDTVFNFFEKNSITDEYCLSMGCYDVGVRSGRIPFLRKAIKCFNSNDF